MARTHTEMDENRIPKRIFQGNVFNRRRKGTLKKRWLDGVIKHLEVMGITEDRMNGGQLYEKPKPTQDCSAR